MSIITDTGLLVDIALIITIAAVIVAAHKPQDPLT